MTKFCCLLLYMAHFAPQKIRALNSDTKIIEIWFVLMSYGTGGTSSRAQNSGNRVCAMFRPNVQKQTNHIVESGHNWVYVVSGYFPFSDTLFHLDEVRGVVSASAGIHRQCIDGLDKVRLHVPDQNQWNKRLLLQWLCWRSKSLRFPIWIDFRDLVWPQKRAFC
jgi:hypothetical protein